MDVNFDWYNVFYYVCEFKSITKTANYLYVSQPAITKNIRNLEKKLGKKLIEKKTNGIEITQDGKKLYDEIKQSIEKLNIISSTFRNRNEDYNQTININAGVTTTKKFLLKALTTFNKKYPNIKFNINAFSNDISIQHLKEGKTDLIFLSEDIYEKTSNGNIVIEPWKKTQICFYISNILKEKIPPYIIINELNNYSIICKMKPSRIRKVADSVFDNNGIKLIPTYELSSNWLVEEYTKLGFGIGITVDNLIKKELESGQYIKIETNVEFPTYMFSFAYRKDSYKIRVIKEFIQEIKKI